MTDYKDRYQLTRNTKIRYAKGNFTDVLKTLGTIFVRHTDVLIDKTNLPQSYWNAFDSVDFADYTIDRESGGDLLQYYD